MLILLRGHPLQPIDADLGLDIKEEDGESSGSCGDFDDSDMEDDYR
jgi:hypothetical protein